MIAVLIATIVLRLQRALKLFNPASVNDYLGCFHFFALTNTIINVLVCAFFCTVHYQTNTAIWRVKEYKHFKALNMFY